MYIYIYIYIYTLFSDRLPRDEHLNQGLLRQLIAWGTTLFLNLFLSTFRHRSLKWNKVKLGVLWVGGVIGNCICFPDHRASRQLRNRLCGEACDLGSSFADAEKHILFETKKADIIICQQWLCNTFVQQYYKFGVQPVKILVFLTGTIFAGTFCTHLEHGAQTSAYYRMLYQENVVLYLHSFTTDI